MLSNQGNLCRAPNAGLTVPNRSLATQMISVHDKWINNTESRSQPSRSRSVTQMRTGVSIYFLIWGGFKKNSLLIATLANLQRQPLIVISYVWCYCHLWAENVSLRDIVCYLCLSGAILTINGLTNTFKQHTFLYLAACCHFECSSRWQDVFESIC